MSESMPDSHAAGSSSPESPVATPQRIQLRRTKGWRKPEGVVNVARPTYWGNPFQVDGRRYLYDHTRNEFVALNGRDPYEVAVEMYRSWLEDPGTSGFARKVEAQIELAGRDLACWCAPDAPCHADVLLEMANPSEASEGEREGEGP